MNVCCLNAARSAMTVRNAVKPAGVPDSYGWNVAPQVVMGARPYASALPSYWQGPQVAEWRAAAVWFVVYEAEGGALSPCDVEITGLQLLVKRRSTGAWHLLQSGPPTWCEYWPVPGMTGAKPAASVGAVTVCRPSPAMFAHGGLERVALPWDAQGADLLEVFGECSFLARGAGRYVVQCGIDYKPTTAKVDGEVLPSTWFPAAALGPFVLAQRYAQHAHVWGK